MNYQEAWQFLDNLQFFKIKLGLDSMNRFLDGVDHPQKDLRFVHVAGTNGKGSVATTLLTILQQAGYSVGLYTSPHLTSVRERFRINNAYISEDEFAEAASRIRAALGGKQITYFEFTTALALLWFASRQVDVAILEVGMGGRLDATNVITPLVSVVTNVSMDHEAYLGDTLAAVAGEKAGIIKPGVPVVSGVAPDVSREVVIETCRKQGAPLYLLGRDFTVTTESADTWTFQGSDPAEPLSGLQCGLLGVHQRDNAALALASLQLLAKHGLTVSPRDIRNGLVESRWPGRLEYVCLSEKVEERSGLYGGRLTNLEPEVASLVDADARRVLIDGAHNPAGVASLSATLTTDFSYANLILVWGSMADKDMAATLAMVAPLASTIILTRPAGERSAEPQQLLAALPDEFHDRAMMIRDVEKALTKARQLSGPDDLICIAGSLYLVGEARGLLLGELIDGE